MFEIARDASTQDTLDHVMALDYLLVVRRGDAGGHLIKTALAIFKKQFGLSFALL